MIRGINNGIPANSPGQPSDSSDSIETLIFDLIEGKDTDPRKFSADLKALIAQDPSIVSVLASTQVAVPGVPGGTVSLLDCAHSSSYAASFLQAFNQLSPAQKGADLAHLSTQGLSSIQKALNQLLFDLSNPNLSAAQFARDVKALLQIPGVTPSMLQGLSIDGFDLADCANNPQYAQEFFDAFASSPQGASSLINGIFKLALEYPNS